MYCGRRDLYNDRIHPHRVRSAKDQFRRMQGWFDRFKITRPIHRAVLDRLQNIDLEIGWASSCDPSLRDCGSYIVGSRRVHEVLTTLCKRASEARKSVTNQISIDFHRYNIKEGNEYLTTKCLPQSARQEEVLFAELVRSGIIELLKELHQIRRVAIITGLNAQAVHRLNHTLDQSLLS